MPRPNSRLLVLLITLMLVFSAPVCGFCQQASDPQATGDSLPRLEWIQLSLGGMSRKIKPGAILALHPDAPFRVLKASTDAWLDYGLSFRLKGHPQVDLSRFHTLSEIFGNAIFDMKHGPQIEVLKNGSVLGGVTLVPRLLPIDWLRRAEAAKTLEDRIRYTKRASDLTPGDRLLTLRLADLLSEAKNYLDAAQILEERLGDNGDPAIQSRLAELYRQLGQTKREAEILEKILAREPGNLEVLQRLISIYQMLQEWELTAALMQRLLNHQNQGDKAGTYRKLALILREAGRPKEAHQALEQAAKLNPRDAKLWRQIARGRKEAGDTQGALAALNRAAVLDPGDSTTHVQVADGLLEDGRKKQAAQSLERALALSPGDPVILTRLAGIYGDLKDYNALITVYQKLLPLKPNDADLRFNLAVLALEAGRFKQALDSLVAAQKLKPDDKEIKLMTLEVLIRMQNWDRALKQAAALLTGSPQDLSIIEMVYSPLSKHRPQGMAALLDQVIAAGSTESKPYKLRAALALESDDAASAIKALKEGVKALPGNLEMKQDLAILYESEAKDEKARPLLKSIIKNDPKNKKARRMYLKNLFRRAVDLSNQEKDEKALDVLGRILDMDPKFPQAEEMYMEIKTRTLDNGAGVEPQSPPDPKTDEQNPAAADAAQTGKPASVTKTEPEKDAPIAEKRPSDKPEAPRDKKQPAEPKTPPPPPEPLPVETLTPRQVPAPTMTPTSPSSDKTGSSNSPVDPLLPEPDSIKPGYVEDPPL